MIKWKRTLRTPSSERLLALRDGKESAIVDLHYLESGRVSGTVVLLSSAGGGWTEEQVPDLLASLDEEFLPEIDFAMGEMTYIVVMGELVGSFEAANDDAG